MDFPLSNGNYAKCYKSSSNLDITITLRERNIAYSYTKEGVPTSLERDSNLIIHMGTVTGRKVTITGMK